jgi:hypothetical protein
LPAVFRFDELFAERRRLALAAGGAVFAVGLWVQVLAGLFYWDHFIRIREAARRSWLAVPTQAAAVLRNNERAYTGMENLYPFPWLPAFSPVEGHWWLARHVLFKHPWERAEADAPWHRYTTLTLDISVPYRGARVDWWYFDWKRELRLPGTVLLVLMALALGGSVALWRRRGGGAAAVEVDLGLRPPASPEPRKG